MKCSKCHNNISEKVNCLLCEEYFCSNECMKSHIILAHNKKNILNDSNNNNTLDKNTNKNKINLQNKKENEMDINIHSPYLIPGILNVRRKYDEKYNLDNFIPIFENGKAKIIGGGSFGKVFLVLNKINKKLYAIKHMEKKILSEKLNNLDGIYKEIYIQSRIDHPNILPILYVNETVSDFDLVLEFASNGSLFHFIRKNKSLNEPLTFSLFIQVVNSVFFLHKNNLIHRDIKPENILLFENNIVKLCDFGWCVKLEEGQQRDTFCGTTEYMSPELVNHEEYSKEIDVWSLGVLLYEMVHGYSPFRPDKPNFNAKDVIINIRKHKLKFNKKVSEECKDLIYHLLEEDSEKRYKVEDIFNSNFVKYYENMKFGFPDNYLVQKYKFKLSKFKSIMNTKLKEGNKIDEDNINKKKEKKNININNKNNEEINNKEKIIKNMSDLDKLKIIYSRKRKNKYEIKSSLSETNLVNKVGKKKLKKNKVSQYFNSINNDDSKKNNFLYGYLKLILNNQNNKNNKDKIEKKEYKSSQNIIKNRKKIKTIIINNNYNDKINNKNEKLKNINKNLKKNNSEKNKYKNIEKDIIIAYNKNIHIKHLKMNKIPINTKKYHHAHSPTSIFNSINNKKYILLNKNISPKNKLNTENNKNNSLKKNKTKIIEVKKTKFNRSPKIILNNNIKKANTRNNLKTHYDFSKIKYNSEENITNTNANTNTNTNNSCINNIINNKDDFIEEKIINKKLNYTKSLTQLKRNFNNNIKSMFISTIRNNIKSNITINSENRKINNLSNIERKYKKREDSNNIKRIHTSVICSPKNNPLITYDNNFLSNKYNKKKNIKYNNSKDNFSPNISFHIVKNNSYSGNNNNFIYKNKYENIKLKKLNSKEKNIKKNFSKRKLLKNNSPNISNNFIEYTKYKINFNQIGDYYEINNKKYNNIYFYNKFKKHLNSIGYNSIYHPPKENLKLSKEKKNNLNIHNITEIQKSSKKNTRIISLKRSGLINKNPKNEYKYFCKNSFVSPINSTRIELLNKIRNNSGNNNESDLNTSKNKIIQKLEIKEFINNIKSSKYKYNQLNTENSLINFNNCNTSYDKKINRFDTNIYLKKKDRNFENKQKLESDIQKSMSLRNNNNINYSRNNIFGDKNKKNIANLKTCNNNLIKSFIENKNLILNNKKNAIKKETHIIKNPILSRHKKDASLIKVNEKNNTEKSNYINKKIINNSQNSYKNKLKNNIFEYK